jgi:SanA protein
MSGFWNNGENDLPSGLYTPAQKTFPWKWISFVFILGVFFVALSFFSVHYAYVARILKLGEIPAKPVALVLGASVNPDGTPSDALMDRIKTGAMLYQYGLVKDILLSGDDGEYHSNEVEAMKKATISLGVPEKHILTDGAGYRTYESCKRAIQTYHFSEAVIVTQRFHLPRALFLCNELGIDSVGVSADLQKYQKEKSFEFREFFASVKAFIDIYIHEPSAPVRTS